MDWFKKILKSKENTSSDAITSQELGEYLFNLCVRQVSSFLDGLDHSQKINKVKANREDINQVELLIAFMWLYFDFLQVEKYHKALTRMHSCFMNHIIKCGLKEDEIWHLLQMRYDEYRKRHSSQGEIDSHIKRSLLKSVKTFLILIYPM